jgi:hypothetical protein
VEEGTVEGMLEKLVEESSEGRRGGRRGVVELGIVIMMKEVGCLSPDCRKIRMRLGLESFCRAGGRMKARRVKKVNEEGRKMTRDK